MRKLTKKQILARLFMAFFAIGSFFCTVNSSMAAGYGTYTLNGSSQTLTDETISPGELSNNTLEVNITSSGSGNTGEIYGGYSNSYDDNGVSSNTVIVTRNAGSNVNTYGIYGGYVNYNGDVTFNKVNINNAYVDSSIYGGYINEYGGGGNIKYNEVTVSNSAVAYSTYGGYFECGHGDAIGNIVRIASSSVGSEVYGGYAYRGAALNNEAYATNSNIAENLYGGDSSNGDSSGNIIGIASSTVKNIYGGYASNGNADENKITITDSIAGSVYGGYTYSASTAQKNDLTISGSTIKSCIYGGWSRGGDVSENKVDVSDSTVANDIYGACTAKGNVIGNKLSISDSNIIGFLFGGYTPEGDVVQNSLDIENSTVEGSILAGEASDGNVTENRLNLSNSIVNLYVTGGGTTSGNADKNTVTISSSTVVMDSYAGWSDSFGDATENKLTATNSNFEGDVYSGWALNGNVENNELIISDSTLNSAFGGYIEIDGSGNVDGNSVTMENSTVNNYIYGGYTSNSGNADGNIVAVTTSTVNNGVYGGYTANNGNTGSNTVAIIDGSNVNDSVYGGYVTNDGDANDNTVFVESSSVNNTVYGSLVNKNGDAGGNKVTIASSTVTNGVYGGYASTGKATQNIVSIEDSTVDSVVMGGLVKNGDISDNRVFVARSNVNEAYGGWIIDNGDSLRNEASIADSNLDFVFGTLIDGNGNAKENKIHISDSTVYSGVLGASVGGNGDTVANSVTVDESVIESDVYGGLSTTGSSTQNIVSIASSSALNVYGGVVDGDGNANGNRVAITDSTINGWVHGGNVTGNGNACDNDVSVDGSTIGSDVVGAEVEGSGNASDNSVTITKSKVCDLYGAYVYDGNAENNVISIASSTVEGDIYGAFTINGKTNNNTVEIKDGTSVTGDIYGGTDTDFIGNKLVIDGRDNTVGGKIVNFETLHFDAADVGNGDTMLTLTTGTAFDIGAKNIEAASSDLQTGERITLISSVADNAYDENIVYKINGKQSIAISPDKHISNLASEDSNKVVHVKELAFEKTDNNLNLSNNGEFISATYIGKDADGNTQNLGKTDMVVESVPENIHKIYGAYSELSDQTAGGAVISIERDNLDLSDVDIVGSYNLLNPTNIDTSNNSLDVNASGVKVKSVEGFGKIALKPAYSETTSLTVDYINLDSSEINTVIPEAFNGTRTFIKSDNAISQNSTTYQINGETLTGSQKYHMAKAGENSVAVGTYQYDTSDDKTVSIVGDSLVAGIYRNGEQQLAAKDNTLVVDSAIASNYTSIYGAYSADNSDATGATVKFNEKIEADGLNVYAGKSNGGQVSDNTLEVTASGAGSKVKSVQGFNKIKIALASNPAPDASMLQADYINLDYGNVNTEFTDGFNGSRTILKSDNAISQNSTTYQINGETLTGSQKYHMAKAGENSVAVGTYQYDTSDDKTVSIVGDSLVAGIYRNGEQQLAAKDNTLVVDSAIASNYTSIYGAYSADGSDATGGIVEIASSVDNPNSSISGGYSVTKGLTAVGNTLRVKTLDARVKGITHFENLDFVLPPETQNGSTMLKVSDAVDMAPTKKIDVDAIQAIMLREGDKVRLIDSAAGINNFGSQQICISGLTDKTGEVIVADKALTLSIGAEMQNQKTKAPVEGIAAAVTNISEANDLASNRLSENMVAVSAMGTTENFAAMSGGNNKFNTGSYVKSNSWNIGFGVGKKGLLKNNPDSTVGFFAQYGKSDFSTHNDNFRGDGDSKLIGGGVMIHHDNGGKYYQLGNIYAGKISTKWNSIAGGYDDSTTYWGFTFGFGSKEKISDNRVLNLYGRYAFNHVGGMEGSIGGYDYHFDSADSSNLRLGMRMEYARGKSGKMFWGLACEHEFSGDCGASMNLGPTEAPSLHGDTGIVEIGYEWTHGNWVYNLGAEGAFGKREGISGSANIMYNF